MDCVAKEIECVSVPLDENMFIKFGEQPTFAQDTWNEFPTYFLDD